MHSIDPNALVQLKSLELRAKFVVEGFLTGLNRSPYHGFSVEFTEYRQYTQGDDPRYLDWRLYARTDRDYIKRFEDETNLRCQLLLDVSKSMAFGSGAMNKSDYARTLAATLAYFLTLQRDAVGLATFSADLEEFIPTRYRAGHLRRILVTLEKSPQGASTLLAKPLEQLAERLVRRGMLVLISDLLAPLETLEVSLGSLAARGQEVLVLQVVDPAEETLELGGPELFEDLETGRQLYVDPAAARSSYLARWKAHQAAIEGICSRLGITRTVLRTNEPLDQSLSSLLRLRLQGRGVSRARAGRRLA
ncbi:DUF58 domain-containing protein [Planctellipticum variicoloris]|jgi:uncharacterized protein (DUF58 family)|uniref:DUF58 domain-containing protein n=1 Tax=Planctellipticum variicoloris TaxID=3064265 RepID=UPI003013CF0F|nr:DUF58 domain-containing protein [Planctomycetaceae bacterium SH412]